ncbi:MAG: 3'(2'),5'-bisphosphate nucleotidase CysQ [Gammaproteobacteria bacterium]|nr:3'(2'),5'-bisphosphate nucleotidase CysQ [Gammaproteobacteria bacterium]MCF6260428.1 3'(2'),5'-bisphosphate nucleotidase CysQ [Gammaproteobacteria bacterium]
MVSSELIDDIIELAIVAGHRILEIYNTDFGVEQKSDNTPLTAADMAAHHIIIEGLGQLTPDIPVLSEESATIPFEKRSQWQRYWLVDPLDGTREFVKRNGEFTVNIALIDNHESVLGVVYAPVTGATYYAARGMGAFKKTRRGMSNNGNKTIAIHTRRKTANNTVITGSRSHRGSSLEAFLQKVGNHEVISMGSSLKSCLVAEGHADIYPRLGPTSEWDTAAAQCIVEEAGGRITKTDMQPLRYNTKDELLNPYFLVIGDPDFDWAQYL